MTKAPSLCIECRDRPKWRPRHRCRECYFRHRPIGERIEEAQRRLALVPVELRAPRVGKKSWPKGRRWCAGCQSFVLLADCRGSRCVPCASMVQHAAMIEKTYGLDGDGYARLLALQGGKCAIGRERPGTKRLAVDHDHKTGEVRGLLCARCNHDLLGGGHDSPLRLLAGWHYLNAPPTSGMWRNPDDGLPVPGEGAGGPSAGEPAFDDLDPPDHVPAGVAAAQESSPYQFVGSGKDPERGRFLVYIAKGETRPPF